MYLTEAIRAEMEARHGTPRIEPYAAEFSEREFDLLRRAMRKRRAHDLTLLIRSGPRLALIRKHGYPPGLFRPPSGGVEPGEPFEAGARREAYEETGLEIVLDRYLVRMDACFSAGGESIPWTTYVLSAWARGSVIAVQDRVEVAEACWATPEAIQAVMRPRMLNWDTAGMRYRVRLQDLALEMLGLAPARPDENPAC